MALGHVLITSVKNEGPFLLEWVAHHLVLGFDHIFVASNDCTDGSDRLLQALQAAGVLHHLPNRVGPDESPQHAGYAALRARHPLDQADWLMVLDADEFLNVHIGAHKVQDLTAAAPADVDIIALSARTFSDLPQVNWQPGRVTQQFPMALPVRNWANSAVKSLTRDPRRFRAIHNHHMVRFAGPGVPRVMRGDGSVFDLTPGLPMWRELRLFQPEQISHDLAQYNHYAVKTWDSFMLRQQRGRGAVPAATQDPPRHTEDYFARRTGKGTAEPSIQRYGAQTQSLMDRLLQDPAIRAAQSACEAAHAAACAPYRRP